MDKVGSFIFYYEISVIDGLDLNMLSAASDLLDLLIMAFVKLSPKRRFYGF